jgi:hypothetical protein
MVRPPSERLEDVTATGIGEAPKVIAARAGLMRALEDYDKVISRLSSAQLQATTAKVSFAARFIVVAEPEFPRKPIKPLRLIVSISSVMAAVLLGFLAGALRDLFSGVIYESWQLRPLGLRSLGALDVPKRLKR